MARDLVRHHLPYGLSSGGVKLLLGPPGEATGSRYEYYLGCWSGEGLDSAFVYVHLDANGNVTGAEITGY